MARLKEGIPLNRFKIGLELDDPKFCRDCRWCVMTENPELALCQAPQNAVPKLDLVTGSFVTSWKWKYAAILRQPGVGCDLEAHWFQPKTETEAA